MLPPPLLTQRESNLLDALALIQVSDPKVAFDLLWQLPLKNRAWMSARAICGYEKLPLDRFSRAVAQKKLQKARYITYLANQS